MADFFDQLSPEHIAFIERQPMFFVATAASSGRINVSPKGYDTFRVIDPKTCAYLDLTGSGNETAAHLKHDGRITVMFNSFEKKPLIMRLYGHGRVAAAGSDAFAVHIGKFPEIAGVRQLIFIDIDNLQTSCGYAVPQMEMVQERPILKQGAQAKGQEGVREYQRQKNMVSIDGFETGLVVPDE